MKPEEIKTRLRDEMADLAPDRLEDLLAACDAQPQEHAPQPQEHAPQPVPMPAPRRPVWKPLAAAAVFVLLLGGIFAVVLMGVYGPGVQASEFVYMQF